MIVEYVGSKRKRARCKCDYCGNVITKYVSQLTNALYQFCNQKCSTSAKRKGEVIDAQLRKRSLVLYGVEHHLQRNTVKLKRETTNLVRYGVTNQFQRPEVIVQICVLSEPYRRQRHEVSAAARRELALRTYGVEDASTLTKLQKYEITCQRLYGVSNSFASEDIKRKMQQTWFERYGVWYASQADVVKRKVRDTCIQRFGGPSPFSSNNVKAKVNWVTLARHCHETMKRNGTYRTSKPEDRLYEVLCDVYATDNVERQALVHRWPIDFYVRSIDTYVQYDSYWHGVGRDIEEVAEHKTPRDVMIHKKMLTDVAQRAYFDEHNMKLVRVQNVSAANITPDVVRSISILDHSV